MLNIVTVCGLGVGSSLILKMTVDAALKELGINANIEHWDMGTVKSKNADLIVTTNEFKKSFEGQENVVFVGNIVDQEEMKTKLTEYFKDKS